MVGVDHRPLARQFLYPLQEGQGHRGGLGGSEVSVPLKVQHRAAGIIFGTDQGDKVLRLPAGGVGGGGVQVVV